jgi:hypothetical protein
MNMSLCAVIIGGVESQVASEHLRLQFAGVNAQIIQLTSVINCSNERYSIHINDTLYNVARFDKFTEMHLAALYLQKHSLLPASDIVVYCRAGVLLNPEFFNSLSIVFANKRNNPLFFLADSSAFAAIMDSSFVDGLYQSTFSRLDGLSPNIVALPSDLWNSASFCSRSGDLIDLLSLRGPQLILGYPVLCEQFCYSRSTNKLAALISSQPTSRIPENPDKKKMIRLLWNS